jgi:Raf kinase inhibitor-like YbhB/YbcL family protein
MAFSLKSSAFQPNTLIPTQYTGEGDDLSPPLEWSDSPRGTQEYALICEDPDAPQESPFVHWLLYHIPNSVQSLPEGIPNDAVLTHPFKKANQGVNSFDSIGYSGPLPPIGHGLHHYVFKLYALRSPLNIPEGAKKEELVQAMEGKILDATQLIGKYIREPQKKTA